MVSVINKDTEEKHTFGSNCKVAYDGCHKMDIKFTIFQNWKNYTKALVR